MNKTAVKTFIRERLALVNLLADLLL